MRSPSKLLALCVLTSALLSVCLAAWQNNWDQHQEKTCQNGEYIRRIKSIHHNYFEDRKWNVSCGKINGMSADQDCRWTGYVNRYDQEVLFGCRRNKVITGMMSDHHNYFEDRRFKFRCCTLSGADVKPQNCQETQMVNEFDGDMDFEVPDNKVIVGVKSVHHNYYEDRRWQFMLCEP